MPATLLNLPKLIDMRGNLTFIENGLVPFEIKRVFWTYDVPGGELRGGHAYKSQEEIIIALSGSFDVQTLLSDGTKDLFSLNRSYVGLYLPPNTWRHIGNFSTNAIGLHLSSDFFDPNDYQRDLQVFLNSVS